METVTTTKEIQRIYNIQKDNFKTIGISKAKERVAKLKKLRKAILDNRKALQDALWQDFRKPAAEVDLTEIYTVTTEIDFAIANLPGWMRPKRVDTPITMFGASSKVVYEPKGMTLIISPWNYPFLLSFAPMVSAIAAGNTVILKPSEFTLATAGVMKSVVEAVFDKNEVALVGGGVATSKTLLDMKFDHIFFTGSPAIGKIVMAAAAKHLSSVTLELGGKCPTIIDETATIKKVVSRIVWAKFVNGGQTCLAPDYIFVHKSKKEALEKALVLELEKCYGENAMESRDYARMINKKNFQRLKGYLDNALRLGAQLVYGGDSEEEDNYIAPALLTNVPLDSDLMADEIFGPILPIFSFEKKQEVINFINTKEKPLALYIYSNSKKNINYFMDNTSAGGSGINISAIHIGNPHLPFGGVNNSGIGKSKGHHGFIEFSNERGVLRQHTPSMIQLLLPPYTSFKRRLIDITLKWF